MVSRWTVVHLTAAALPLSNVPLRREGGRVPQTDISLFSAEPNPTQIQVQVKI